MYAPAQLRICAASTFVSSSPWVVSLLCGAGVPARGAGLASGAGVREGRVAPAELRGEFRGEKVQGGAAFEVADSSLDGCERLGRVAQGQVGVGGGQDVRGRVRRKRFGLLVVFERRLQVFVALLDDAREVAGGGIVARLGEGGGDCRAGLGQAALFQVEPGRELAGLGIPCVGRQDLPQRRLGLVESAGGEVVLGDLELHAAAHLVPALFRALAAVGLGVFGPHAFGPEELASAEGGERKRGAGDPRLRG